MNANTTGVADNVTETVTEAAKTVGRAVSTVIGVVPDEHTAEETVLEWQHFLEIVSGLFVLASLVISGYGIYKHLVSYVHPERQRRVVRILGLVPIYSLDSWFSLVFVEAALYLDTLRDVYEAYVLYQFFLLCVSYLGGEAQAKLVLSRKADMAHSWPMNYCFSPIQTSSPYFFLNMKRGILQFVVLKPLGAIFAVVAEATGVYCNGEWKFNCAYLYHTILINVSVSIALYCLILFYKATKEELTPWKPLWKFLCIKAVIFFSFWQGVCFSFMIGVGLIRNVGYYSTEYLSYGLQDFLICIEMLFIAVAHLFVFNPEEYIDTSSGRPRSKEYAVRDVFAIGDVVQDTRETFNIMRPAYTALETTDLPDAAVIRTMRGNSNDNSEFYQLNSTDKSGTSTFDNIGTNAAEELESWGDNRPSSRSRSYGGLGMSG
ncbi:hypothetical protein SARC_11531 [Sphaeroforma arctica JP610]|uniref:Uncharacterized protein n=1 Tax=Sphaeroforma arctica JP610 TaxID=667725 RepID=A0A0L0FGP9_9EUKA|nr:hypothetical protein SARC_11531 [Sphaeroforma arctica JP610]KNC75952.1 hypothetical protein SARC_11531 [Sphaeroforma arctica JP610]|eukprot:XP_014149854.1 hypothetical protein SARC_11531 [Sphaeroforma arctica JP610]